MVSAPQCSQFIKSTPTAGRVIDGHFQQFRQYLSGDDAVGRRLDFLLQEINREVNTMGSKSADSSISGRTVEIKAELEKIREQVQNVE